MKKTIFYEQEEILMVTRFETENIVIGFLLSSNTRGVPFVLDTGLDESCFSDMHMRMLYDACLKLYYQKKEVDVLNIQSFFNEQDDNYFRFNGSDALITKERLITLSKDAQRKYPIKSMQISIISACYYLIEEARRQHVLQQIIETQEALQSGKDLFETIAKSVSELLKIQSSINSISKKSYLTLSDAINEKQAEIQNEIDGKTSNCYSTGIEQLDSILQGGLYSGRFVAIGAEAKHFKSTLAHTIGINISTKRIPVGVVTLEMKASEIVGRFAGAQNTDSPKDRLIKLNAFARDHQSIPLHFRQGGVTSKTMLSIAMHLVNEKKCKVLIVDYLQLIQLTGKERTNEIDAFIASLKSLSLDLNIAVLLITALNTKSIGPRSTKKPIASDVRDTGRLVYDVDTLLLMWKPKYDTDPSYIEVFVCASRNGEDGVCAFRYDADLLSLVPTEIDKRSRGDIVKRNLSYCGDVFK